MDEGEGVALPEGDADVGDVKAGDGAGESDDVAAADVLGAGGKGGFGDVPVAARLKILLHAADLRHICRTVAELLV